jgi:hypothetical protein
MSQLVRKDNLTPAVSTDDGWGDAAADGAERIMRGTFLKFADWNWTTGKEGTKVKENTQLVAVGTAVGWVKWQGGKPVEYKMREPGRRLPDREELDALDESEWENGPDGKPKDPWQFTRFVYLVDPFTAEAFTFSTSSWGGRGAVMDLADQIQRMRYARPGAVPVVELRHAPMMTKFGKKSKPLFKVVDWRMSGGFESTSKAAAPAPQIDVNKPAQIEARPAQSARDLDDEIPF